MFKLILRVSSVNKILEIELPKRDHFPQKDLQISGTQLFCKPTWPSSITNFFTICMLAAVVTYKSVENW